jgi:exodeoxyribonuclease VII large subunit
LQAYSLLELNQFFRRVVSLNFPDAVWVKAEIGQLSESRGHYYLTLIQRDAATDTLVAQSQAVLWQTQSRKIRKKLGSAFGQVFQQGLEVSLQVEIRYDERYGLKFHIVDIDLSFVLGQMELQRQQILQTLKEEQLLELNRTRPLPRVAQSIAVISSATAAGFEDFQAQLLRNNYGYRFLVDLFPAAMQGEQTEVEVLAALTAIEQKASQYDCVVIIRGGGSRIELAAFDNLPIARRIAKFPLPVLSGIGHETDQTVVDAVAHQALKTPTAVAEFLIDRLLEVESDLVWMGQRLSTLVNEQLAERRQALSAAHTALRFARRQSMQDAQNKLTWTAETLRRLWLQQQRETDSTLDKQQEKLSLLDPERILERGYVWVSQAGQPIKRKAAVHTDQPLELRFQDGTLSAQPKKDLTDE